MSDIQPASDLWIGIDTGGTFTDLVMVDRSAGTRVVHKLPTMPADPARGILTGLAALLRKAGRGAGDVTFLAHGTTLATNAILMGRTARTGMITTAGFRDILEIGRQRRPAFYDLTVAKPTPPVKRDLIAEVAERLDERGKVVTPLDEDAVRAATETLKVAGAEAVAICFMHAYADPAHERRAKEIVQAAWPEAYLCASHEVLREFREFERFATTAVNASLLPVIDAYLARFEAGLGETGVRVRPLVMQSNGGAVSPETVRRAPINTFFSGPAGGVIATAELGRRIDMGNMISFDMGGTSTDVCLIKDGGPAKRSLSEMAGFPVRIPTLDLHTIGAGGGSIAWVDPGGLLKVGPQSAGADPGPALYGRGGGDATVTDANVVLGRLVGEALIGGAMEVYPERSHDAVAALGERIGFDPAATAAGIVEIVNVNMTGAVRVASIEKGEDPRNYALVAFGGAGPLHAAEVAAEMGIKTVIVPARPGLLSAFGLLDADLRGDFSMTRLVLAEEKNMGALIEGLEILDERGTAWSRGEGLEAPETVRERAADLRYFGQAYEITVPLPNGQLNAAALRTMTDEFHRRHEAVNGYRMPERSVEIVNLRLGVAAVRPPAGGREAAVSDDTSVDPVVGEREVWFRGTGFTATPVYDRAGLTAGQRFAGPAIVEQMDATTVVPPGVAVEVDGENNLILRQEEGS